MAGEPRQYDPKAILASAAGNILTDFAEDSMVTVAWESDSYSDRLGADGFVARSRSRDDRATITISLSQRSPSNAVLYALHKADRTTGRGMFPFVLKDLNGVTLIVAPFTWVQKRPDIEFGKESGDMEWTLRTANADGTIGGEV